MGEFSKSKPSEYDPVTDYHYLKFENRCLRASGDDFQNLFEAIMVRARPGEFERVRPYGKYGDRKCDGLIESEGIIFQVYSPDELKQAEVQKKIEEDLGGAVQHWSDILKKWVFVYNAKRGSTADVKLTLQQKRQHYSGIEIDCWSNDYLWEIARNQLSLQQRCEILGAPPQSIANTKQIATYLVPHQEHKTKWWEICRELLNHWKGLTTNALMKSHGVRFQLDEIFVPLGVVERRKQSKHRFNDGASAEQGSELYEEKITPISQSDFFEQVLRQRQSKYSQGKRIAIIGEPGAGKTTQLQKIGDWVLEETDGIPIWIPLAEVGTRKLREYLLGDWLQTAIQELEVSPEHRDELGQLLRTGKVWLLLDGVDEMAISDALYQIATQMREGWLQNVQVVLTCRLNVWDAGKNALDGFDVYRNLDFEYPTEVHQLVGKWFATEPALQQKLTGALEQPGKERIRDMVKNPLRLTLLCYSWQLRQGELPETKARLYEWFVDAFYEWNKGKVPIKLSAAKREELNRALGELAKEAIDQESSRFCLREKFVNRFLGAADDEDSLFYLALQLGWLNRIGVAEENPLENVYAFFHPTFQEYFAALAVPNWNFFLNQTFHNPAQGRYLVFEPVWQEVILLWLGRLCPQISGDQKNAFIKALIDFEDNCQGLYSYRAYFCAITYIAEFTDCHYADSIIKKVIEWTFGYFDQEDKTWKVHYFFSRPDIVSQPALTRLRQTDKVKLEIELLNFLSSLRSEEIGAAVSQVNGASFYEKLVIQVSLEILEIDPGNSEARIAITELINSSDSFISKNLKGVDSCELIKHIKNSIFFVNETSQTHVGKIVDESTLDCSNIISDSLHQLAKIQDGEPAHNQLLSVLEESIPGNPNALSPLIEIIENSLNPDFKVDRYVIFKAVGYIGRLGVASPEAADILMQLLRSDINFGNYATRDIALSSLIAIGFGNQDVFKFLIELVHEKQAWAIHVNSSSLTAGRCTAVNGLGIISKDLFELVVLNLKDYLQDTFNVKDPMFKWACYATLFHCAQNMSYSDFYRAWHSLTPSTNVELSTDNKWTKL